MTPSPASLVCRPAACYTSPPLWVAPGTSTERTVLLHIHICPRQPGAKVDFVCRDVPGARPRRFHWPRCNNNNNVGGLRLLRFTLTDLPLLRPSSPPNSHFAQNRVGLGARHARHRQLSPYLETRLPPASWCLWVIGRAARCILRDGNAAGHCALPQPWAFGWIFATKLQCRWSSPTSTGTRRLVCCSVC